MAGKDKKDLRTKATTLTTRLTGKEKVKLPAALTAAVKEALAVLQPFLVAVEKADAATQARDDKLELVAEADGVLDLSLDDLAAALVGAKITKPKSAFAGLSKYPPSKLRVLGYQAEVDATRDLLAVIAKKKPDAAVRAVAARVAKNAAEVAKRLAAVSAPEAAYVKALTARDGRLEGVSRAIQRLKVRAKGVLVDEPETFAALFAPANPVQAPVKKRARKKPPAPTPPAGGSASASAASASGADAGATSGNDTSEPVNGGGGAGGGS